ncbi:uncharacterized protein LOC118189498 isoform X2 [Stegodyphus dumicola]|nr:uncharacterized protein LOC118189498 isoform X2 [Stegodyphus dumicola]
MDNPASEQSESPSSAELRCQKAELSTIIEEYDNYFDTEGAARENDENDGYFVPLQKMDQIGVAEGNNDEQIRQQTNICSSCRKKPETRNRRTQANLDLHGIPPSCVVEAKNKPETRSRRTQANLDLHGIPPSWIEEAKNKPKTRSRRTQVNLDLHEIPPSCVVEAQNKPETRSMENQANLDLHGIPPSWVEESRNELDSLYKELKNFKNAFLHRYFAQGPDNVPREENSNTADFTQEVTNCNTADLEPRLESILKAAKKCKRMIPKLRNFCLKQDGSEQVQELQSNSNANCASNTVHENPSFKISVKSETATEVHQKGDQASFEPFHFSEYKKMDVVPNQVKALDMFDPVNAMNKGYQLRDFGTRTEGEIAYSNKTHGYYDETDSDRAHRCDETDLNRIRYDKRDSFVKKKPNLATASRGDRNFNVSSTTDARLKRGCMATPSKGASAKYSQSSLKRKAGIFCYRRSTRSLRKIEPTNLSKKYKNYSYNLGTYDSLTQGSIIQNESVPKTGSSRRKHAKSDSNTRSEGLYENHGVVSKNFNSSDCGNSNVGECGSSNQSSIVRSELLPKIHVNNKVIYPDKQEISGTEPKKSYADAVAFKK